MQSSQAKPAECGLVGDPEKLAAALLDWYDAHARDLPWRVSPKARRAGATPDPYRVWLSEIMLQQTTVEAVKPYFQRFVAEWPSVRDLAAADADAVMKAWAGLGYYARARNLLACAKAVAEKHGGGFPQTEAELRKLPGLGAYTAAAVAAIAFEQKAAVVDGNVERVIARMIALPAPPRAATATVRETVARIVPEGRPGDFAQATMDLGATICTPRRPACILCPWCDWCRARRQGEQELFPVKTAKPSKPDRVGAVFVALRRDGAVLLRRREAKGLLGGMAELPTSGWSVRGDGDATVNAAPFPAMWRKIGEVAHGFTHFNLALTVFRADGVETAKAPPGHWWSRPDEIAGEALPTIMRNALKCAIPPTTEPKLRSKL